MAATDLPGTSLPSLDGYAFGYPGDERGIALPMFWDEAISGLCNKNGWWVESQEWLMRRMMREVGILAADRVFRALVTEGEHTLTGRVPEPPKGATRAERQRFKRSEEALAFTKAWVERMPYDLARLSWDLCEAFAFGSKLMEAELSPFVFNGQSYVAPIDLAPKPRTVYEYLVDKSNRVLGVRPRMNAEADVIPRANLLILSVGGMDRIPTGEPILASLYRSWHRKQEAYEDESKTAKQSGFIVVNQSYPPQGVTDDGTVRVQTGTDEFGKPVLTPKSKLRVAAESVAAARRGMTAAMPPGMSADMMKTGDYGVFSNILDRCDREFAMGYLGAARATQEAQHGSKADSGQGADIATTLRDWGRGLVTGSTEEYFGLILSLNFGDKYADVIPIHDIVTEESTDLDSVGNFFAGNFDRLTLEQKNVLAARAGLPEFPEEDQPDQELQQIDQQAQAEADQATQQFVARFSGKTDFKTKLEIANTSAQNKVSGATKSAARQFRSLVDSLDKGTRNGKPFTEKDFVDRFAYTLQVAHERAVTIGFKHGGGSELSPEAEDYLATVVSEEGQFAQELADALVSGDKSLAQARLAAKRYAARIGGSANEAFRLVSVASGETIDWELGGVEMHCPECPEYADMSPWQPDELFTVPRGGKTPCRMACACRLVRSDGRIGFSAVSLD